MWAIGKNDDQRGDLGLLDGFPSFAASDKPTSSDMAPAMCATISRSDGNPLGSRGIFRKCSVKNYWIAMIATRGQKRRQNHESS